VGFPSDKLAIGLALIFAVDRPLDMFRTVINVTGDATVSMMVAKSLGKLGKRSGYSTPCFRFHWCFSWFNDWSCRVSG
ncbi:MAG: cation:dicarboxylase symporter family transporter, partial [Bacteroidota bacterium]